MDLLARVDDLIIEGLLRSMHRVLSGRQDRVNGAARFVSGNPRGLLAHWFHTAAHFISDASKGPLLFLHVRPTSLVLLELLGVGLGLASHLCGGLSLQLQCLVVVNFIAVVSNESVDLFDHLDQALPLILQVVLQSLKLVLHLAELRVLLVLRCLNSIAISILRLLIGG